jgi:uncharacterized protein GlcG (DUF336 family)
MGHTTDLPLGEARALIARAVDKAEDIGMRGAVAVVGGTGTVVSASRMDHGGAGGMARARSKAWIAATQQITSAEHLKRMQTIPPPMVSGFTACSPEARFPGAGGMPIRAAESDGWPPGGPVVAGIAASGAGIGPFAKYPGADPQKLIADGRPANGEDLLVHYALGIPYEGQHGDDLARWEQAYGAFPANPGAGLGMAPCPRASRQSEHMWALGLADTAMTQAARHGLRIAVAIVDERGDPIQQDRMDGATATAVEMALATATTAATFGATSEEVGNHFRDPRALPMLAASLPFALLAIPGAVPVLENDRTVGAIGVAGAGPELCAGIAVAARATVT